MVTFLLPVNASLAFWEEGGWKKRPLMVINIKFFTLNRGGGEMEGRKVGGRGISLMVIKRGLKRGLKMGLQGGLKGGQKGGLKGGLK